MIKYNDNSLAKIFYDSNYVNKAYINGSVAYTRYYRLVPQNPCYAVTDDISTYSDRTFSDVYDTSASKWYKLNNLNAYEEYGVYATSTASTETTYDGKLAKVGDYEYEYTNGEWTNIGMITATTEYAWVDFQSLDFTRSYPTFRKVRLNKNNDSNYSSIYISPTTGDTSTSSSNRFIVSNSDAANAIYDNGTSKRWIDLTLVGDGIYEYTLSRNYYLCGSDYYMGIYTESICSNFLYVQENVTIYTYPKEYTISATPPQSITANTLEALYDYICPYVGLIGFVGSKAYRFNDEHKWVEISYVIKGVKNGEEYAVYSNDETVLTTDDVSDVISHFPSSSALYDIDIYIGDKVSRINDNCFSMKQRINGIYIPSSVNYIGARSFYFPNKQYGKGMTFENPNYNGYIGSQGLSYCTVATKKLNLSGATFENNRTYFITLIYGLEELVLPSSITQMTYFEGNPELLSLTMLATTPPTISGNFLTKATNLEAIYVPSSSVDAYKTATNWSNYADRIQAIPSE